MLGYRLTAVGDRPSGVDCPPGREPSVARRRPHRRAGGGASLANPPQADARTGHRHRHSCDAPGRAPLRAVVLLRDHAEHQAQAPRVASSGSPEAGGRQTCPPPVGQSPCRTCAVRESDSGCRESPQGIRGGCPEHARAKLARGRRRRTPGTEQAAPRKTRELRTTLRQIPKEMAGSASEGTDELFKLPRKRIETKVKDLEGAADDLRS